MRDAQVDDVHSRYVLAQLWHLVTSTRGSPRDVASHKRIVNGILAGDFDLNYKVTVRPNQKSFHREDSKESTDCTALHFLYHDVLDIDTFATLLDRGADFTIKNANGQTVLHSAIAKMRLVHSVQHTLPFVNSVLSAHVKLGIAANPRDDNGISHLHGACAANHLESLQFFLDKGAPVDQAVGVDSKRYPGFTPLHFAAEFDSFEAAEMLLRRGAQLRAGDAQGMTALDVCVKRRLDLLSDLHKKVGAAAEVNPLDDLRKNEKVIKLLLEYRCVSAAGLADLQIACALEDLTLAESLFDGFVVDIDETVPDESPIRPGSTAAHFAAWNSIDAVKMLARREAKFAIADAEGSRAVDVCAKNFGARGLHEALSCSKQWSAALLSDGRTKLLDLLLATASSTQLKTFLPSITADTIVPADSAAAWQGNTILHLAVITSSQKAYDQDELRILYDESVVEECLRLGHSVNVRNSRGETPVHVALKLDKKNILRALLDRLDSQEETLENVADRDNLTYLHVACVERRESLVEKLLRVSGPNVACQRGTSSAWWSIAAGWTPLHVVAGNGAAEIARTLLRHGADLHAADVNGMTPVHYLLERYPRHRVSPKIEDVLFDWLMADPRDCVVDGVGLSYLHVACHFGNARVVRKLLELGADANAAISYEDSSGGSSFNSMLTRLASFSADTPLSMTRSDSSGEIVELLLLHGADVFARNSNDTFPLQDKNVLRGFLSYLWGRDDSRKAVEDKLGLTRLHVACYLKNEEAIESVLDGVGADVDARVHGDSVIFAGCTPLHLLLTFPREETIISRGRYDRSESFPAETTMKLLLDRGADVTVRNAEGNTAVHLFYKYRTHIFNAERCENLLWNAHRDFGVDPVNSEGLSHFHLACRSHNFKFASKFLQGGSVDVNRPVDFFAEESPGSTALHLVLSPPRTIYPKRMTPMIDMLVKHGANIVAKDVYGDTPLHKPDSLYSPNFAILNKLVSHGADIRSENVKGQTPFDKCTFDKYDRDNYVNLFKTYNYEINNCNRLTGEGYLAKMLLSHDSSIIDSPPFEELLQSLDATAVDEMGRTVIHNSVAVIRPTFSSGNFSRNNFISAIKRFIKLGINLEHQDKSGQTALHYAARMENVYGVVALLKCGADINVLDNSGMSPFSYATNNMEHNSNRWSYYVRHDSMALNVAAALNLQMRKLIYLELEVSEINKRCSNRIQKIVDGMAASRANMWAIKNDCIRKEVEMSKAVDVGAASLVLFDFLNETGGVTLYPDLPISQQTVINDFFKDFKEQEFAKLSDIINLQFRKMTVRLELIDEAIVSLRILLGFSLPGLCEQISRFLLNSDLKNVIASTAL